MSGKSPARNTQQPSDSFEQARDELFSHILRCGVLKAAAEHQKEWFDDTMEYLADRFVYLTDEELEKVRKLGEQYCRPVINRGGEERENSESERVSAAN
jgi:hypothetical protein